MEGMTGKVAVITGAGSGMGRAAALLFAQRGMGVACADRDADSVDSTRQEIEAGGGKAIALTVDVTQAEQVESMIASAEQQLGGVDVLYNNAGLWRYATDGYVEGVTDAPAPLLSEDIWDETVAVNLKGTYLGCRFGIPAMRRRGGGAIINVSSVGAFRVGKGSSDAYTAAKGGVLAITRSLAVEHAKENIRVNCVVPGPIMTPLLSRFAPDDLAAAAEVVTPMGRFGEPEEVAEVAYFLASDASSFCTAQTFVVDGGFLAY